MTTKRYQLENYRKYLLNRVTATPHFVEYIENCLATEDESAHHSFHKIMVHNWVGNNKSLFEALAEYFSPSFIPVNFTSQGAISTFYTSSLSLVLKITKLDFMFPHQRNMFNMDILFNDKTSADCFENRITIDDIITGIVSNRFTDKFELDLTDFCNDPEFLEKKIHFYKLNLLSHFKILMLRMGRDTKSLNLSNNNLSQVPVDILNFFIKGDLISINFSNNNLPSLQELQRVSSKIEKLWLEGNPLCKELDPIAYVKNVTKKFPRLNELDGIRLNEHGFFLPFFKNFLVTPDKKTKMLVERFLCFYFAHYDSYPRNKIENFYNLNANLTLAAPFTDEQEKTLESYPTYSRNILHPKKRSYVLFNNKKYRCRDAIRTMLSRLPESEHDPSSFTVDVLKHDKKTLVLVVDGVYREKNPETNILNHYFQFRRTFVITADLTKSNQTTQYYITNEMFQVSFATKEIIENSFKDSTRCTNQMALYNPDPEYVAAISNIFSHITELKIAEAEARLKTHNYILPKVLKIFINEFKENKIFQDKFIQEDDFSDTSSLIDEEMD